MAGGPVITIMGPIGSGKTMQANLLAKALGWQTFSTGQLIRDGDNQLAKELHDKGILAPTEFVQEMILSKIKSYPPNTGIILDGSPRMIAEAERYDKDLPALGRKMNLVIVLGVDRKTIDERLTLRGRDDDTPEGIKARFAQLTNDILPAIERYRTQGIVREVDGDEDAEKVSQRIVRVIKDANLV